MSERTAIFNTPKKQISESQLNHIRNSIYRTPSVQRNVSKVREEQLLKNIMRPSAGESIPQQQQYLYNTSGSSLQGKSIGGLEQRLQQQKQLGTESNGVPPILSSSSSLSTEEITFKENRYSLSIVLQLKRVIYNLGINLVLKLLAFTIVNNSSEKIIKIVHFLQNTSKTLILLNLILLIWWFFQYQKLKYYKMSIVPMSNFIPQVNDTGYGNPTTNPVINIDNKNTVSATTNTPYLFKNIQSTPLKADNLKKSVRSYDNNNNNSSSQRSSSMHSQRANFFASNSSGTSLHKTEQKSGYIPSNKYTFKMMDTPRKQTAI